MPKGRWDPKPGVMIALAGGMLILTFTPQPEDRVLLALKYLAALGLASTLMYAGYRRLRAERRERKRRAQLDGTPGTG